MATITAGARSYHGTLTANTVDVVTLDATYPTIEIINRDATADLWVTVDRGPTGSETTLTPTVAGAGTLYVGPGAARTMTDEAAQLNAPASRIRLISANATAYSVTGHFV